MHLFAARIALLAYLVGGLAIPAMHQHGLGNHGAGHTHAGHSHAGQSHTGDSQRVGGCCHTAPATACDDSSACDDSAAKESAASDRAPARTAVAATVPHDAACGADCVICGFLSSAQTSAADAPLLLVPEPLRRLAAAPQGPGFDAANLRIDRLRGPPLGVILG